MQLPKNLLSPGTYTKPRLFLCEVDKEPICQLDAMDMNGSFKFNSFSELNFEVPRVYNDIITGETRANPFYDKIESPRLVCLEDFGYFELQGPELISDGIKESKKCLAYSSEYTLSTKFLENFYINTGKVDSLEVLNAKDQNDIVPIVLYDSSNPKLSLLHLALEKIYGWKIRHVDAQLRTLSRQFEIDRASVYDFLMTEVCEKFNCYIVFNTIYNFIDVYAESPTAKFIGDGKTSIFIIKGADDNNSPFSRIETVSVDGYKTTRWTYGISDGQGVLVLEDIPEDGAMVEAVGVDSEWETDVFVSFDNLTQEVNVSYDSDNIKTVLTVTYGEDEDIRETNLGLPYLTDISYYYTVDWMGQELYDAYGDYLKKTNECQPEYTRNSKEILKVNDQIYFEEHRLSLEYSKVSVDSSTVGKYYVRETSFDGQTYYYTEVSLPSDYKTGVDYYSNATTNLNETKVNNLYKVLESYFYSYHKGETEQMGDALSELDELSEEFKFMQAYTISYLSNNLKNATSKENMESTVNNFLGEMWNEVGRTPLKTLYLPSYKSLQEVNSGYSQTTNENYGKYYTAVLFITSIESAITKRDKKIAELEKQRKVYQDANAKISDELVMHTFFKKYYTDQGIEEKEAINSAVKLLIKLSAFLREDELHIDDIVETSLDDLSSSFKLKQDAMETGRIELRKLCQPQLQFTMDMANIYALEEFEPIIHQFQLGKIIKVAIRNDYIKQSRLLQVDINFEDFSDFSCEFGELTSLRTQSDIHADLLSQAISAGKSVAGGSSYWTKGADRATATDLKIQQGLLDATTQIKAMDGTQGVVIDKYGIKLQKKNGEEIDPKQAWLVNNMILWTDDNWKTSKTGIGEFTVPDGDEEKTFYGLIAEAVLAGYIEGSTIVGSDIIGESTIRIGKMPNGKWAFEVDKYGNVSMLGGEVKFNVTDKNGSYTDSSGNSNSNSTIDDIQGEINEIKDQLENIDGVSSNMYRVEIISDGPTVVSTPEDKITLTCKVYSWDSEITDLDQSLFNWKRVSSVRTIDENGLTEDDKWNNMPEHKGKKSIVIDADDILENSSFTCEVELQD